MYKVFINNKAVVFVEDMNNFQLSENDRVLKCTSAKVLFTEFEKFIKDDSKINLFVISEKNVEKLFKIFTSFFKKIEAAGGMVRNAANKIMLIYRYDKWDLPKGKMKKNEEPDKAAIREVMEETGISDIKIIKKLPCTYHIYTLKGDNIIKKTYWYEMFTESVQTPVPQTEEDITNVRWMNKQEITKALKNTYRSIFELFRFSNIFEKCL